MKKSEYDQCVIDLKNKGWSEKLAESICRNSKKKDRIKKERIKEKITKKVKQSNHGKQ